MVEAPRHGVVIQFNPQPGAIRNGDISVLHPTIYVIADDMKKVQIQASVAEADIGRIAEGMAVVFTVDAHRTDRFKGKVAQIRLSPTTVQNVVTYTVMIGAENPGNKLLPGMTANVSFDIAQYRDVLKIPNAALRFTPPPDVVIASGMTEDGYIPVDSATLQTRFPGVYAVGDVWPAPGGGVKLSAGWLIERAGIDKGMRRGAVGVSTAHALALVHHGGGSTAALLALAHEVRDAVRARYAITLTPEPTLIGLEWSGAQT